MGKCYINGIGSVSAQDNSSYDIFLENYSELTESIVNVHKPEYKKHIKPTLIRRMANGVKNGVVASSIALKDAMIEKPQAIITGTGMGCLVDSEKFLKNVIDNDEKFLTPTSFIQSTHNTVGGQIALGLNCQAYNVTYAHNSTSFESSLIDALLMINDGETDILVGGIDEIGSYTASLFQLVNHIKKSDTLSQGILNSNSSGSIYSEGAQFFSLQNKITPNTYARLVDVEIYDTLNSETVTEKLVNYLNNNGLKTEDIDLVVLGKNGDKIYDKIYDDFCNSNFKNTQQIYYKHLCGEYHTASAFGLWITGKICKTQQIPNFLKLNNMKVTSIKNILLYNQYRGEGHSFTLVQSC